MSLNAPGTATRLGVETHRLVDEILAGDYRSVFKGRGLDFEELRAYEPGDDLRTIDWNVTARIGTAHVRQYREERELNVIIALDRSASLGPWAPAKQALAIDLAAALCTASVHHRDRAGLLLFGTRLERFIAPARGRPHLHRLLQVLRAAPKDGERTSLRAALSALHQHQSRRAVVFLISDFLDEGYADVLPIVSRRHDVIPLLIRDAREETLPDVGRVHLQDVETGALHAVDTSVAAVRQRYAAQAQARRDATLDLFRRAGCPGLSLAPHDDVVDRLSGFLRQRVATVRSG